LSRALVHHAPMRAVGAVEHKGVVLWRTSSLAGREVVPQLERLHRLIKRGCVDEGFYLGARLPGTWRSLGIGKLPRKHCGHGCIRLQFTDIYLVERVSARVVMGQVGIHVLICHKIGDALDKVIIST
jgi:hypothetical protein